MLKHHQRDRPFSNRITYYTLLRNIDTYISLKPSCNIWSEIHSRRFKNPKHWACRLFIVEMCKFVCYVRVHTFPIEHRWNWENEKKYFFHSIAFTCLVLPYHTIRFAMPCLLYDNNNCVHCVYSWIYHDDVYVEAFWINVFVILLPCLAMENRKINK